MEMFSLSEEAEAVYQEWLHQLTDDSAALLACNDPNWRKLLVEHTANHFQSYQHIILDLSETRVESWNDMITAKLGAPTELAEDVMLHVVNLEMSYLESKISPELATANWGAISADRPIVRVYCDEPLLEALKSAPNEWLASIAQASVVPSGAAALPYQTLEQITPDSADTALQVADLLALAGAVAHAGHWYEQALALSAPVGLVALGQGELALHRGDFQQAEGLMHQALESLEEAQASEKGRAYLALGRIAFGKRAWKSCIHDLEKGKQHFSADHHPEEWGELSRIQGRAWEQIGEPTKAVESFATAGRHWATYPQYAMAAAKAFQAAAAICQNQHLHSEALSHFSSAVPLAKTAGEAFLVASLEDSVEAMEELLQKAEKRGKKGLFGKLFS